MDYVNPSLTGGLKSVDAEKKDYEEAKHKEWAIKNGYSMSKKKMGGRLSKFKKKKK